MKSPSSIASLISAVAIAGSAAAADEAAALAVLASDADTEKKVQACNDLAVVGTAKSVPTLGKLLADEQLNDYARTALEVMEDPAATRALLDALPGLKDRLLAAAVTSLGYRGDASAVPALQKLANDPSGGVCQNAMGALAMIGGDQATRTLVDILRSDRAECRVHAAHAALLAAERLKKAGKSPATLLAAIKAADVPANIKAAAAAM